MKLAPLARALQREGVRHVIVHTGQHYDQEMSAAFFADLAIPAPDHNLEVGSASHAQQTAAIMVRLEPVLQERRPDVLLVYGDVNSTVAAALVAAKMGIPVAHVEAGLRSRDWTMPEEINRVVTDRLADFLFTPSRDADDNLRAEGIPADRIHFVGNIMIDALVHALPKARALAAATKHGVTRGQYILVTLHRPSNVDRMETLRDLMTGLAAVARERAVIFPVHPRTRGRLREHGIGDDETSIQLVDPLGYIEMLSLVADAGLVVTDSGGLQEETSYLGVPCLTLRPNTERPVTITQGTNRLVPSTSAALQQAVGMSFGKKGTAGSIELWDGKAGERIAGVLLTNY
jgi:UDP-N-acetylglucosamine 2-epimerase (non-hydrolysing)